MTRTPSVLPTDPDLATLTYADQTGPPGRERGQAGVTTPRDLDGRRALAMLSQTSRARDGRQGYYKWPTSGRSMPPVTVDQLDLSPKPVARLYG